VPLFLDQIEAGGPITLTDKKNDPVSFDS